VIPVAVCWYLRYGLSSAMSRSYSQSAASTSATWRSVAGCRRSPPSYRGRPPSPSMLRVTGGSSTNLRQGRRPWDLSGPGGWSACSGDRCAGLDPPGGRRGHGSSSLAPCVLDCSGSRWRPTGHWSPRVVEDLVAAAGHVTEQ